ncbi:hypothetical protein Acr_29g0010700 [Actinidia rufa]|uniref:Uncharacterized protein n=1 Tax=Actinidia rufa TaxID=165716 RepID=A0A7J0HFS4_9ERIC|nr:hypothetical protein Acr_29g0010700 [Actinidia rufa]
MELGGGPLSEDLISPPRAKRPRSPPPISLRLMGSPSEHPLTLHHLWASNGIVNLD